MRHPFGHPHFRPPRFHHRRCFPFFGGGRLLGLIGLTALGVTLLNNRQREQRRYAESYVDSDKQKWQGG